MAGRVPYSPVQSATPELVPTQPIRTDANPAEFGGLIGQATEKLGSDAGEATNVISQALLQRQGMINETLATDAETKAMGQYGDVVGKFKSLNGLAAVAQAPKTQADITSIRQNIASQLPAGAARSFNLLALRHEGYALQDVNSYAAQQVKSADTESAKNSMTVSINRASDPNVALSDARFGEVLGDTNFAVTRILNNQGYGPDGRTGMTQDPKTGAVSFDESKPEGQQAKAVYTQMLQQAQGQAWENRIQALANNPNGGNVNQANAVFQANKSQIPPEAQAKLSAWLLPKVRGEQAQGTADAVLSQTERAYQDGVAGMVNGNAPAPAQGGGTLPKATNINDAIINQESGNSNAAPTSVNGAVGPGQITPGTFAQYAKPGESINNPTDNRNVANRVIDDLKSRYPNDPARVAVGYFSGPGNVAPAGSATPYLHDYQDKNGKTVSSYVSDIQNRLGGNGAQPSGDPQAQFQSRANYYRTNYANILQNARDQATNNHPDDPVFQQQAVSRVETQISNVIHQQDLMNAVDQQTVYKAFNGDFTKGARPTSVQQMVSADPSVQGAWDRMQANNPIAASAVETRILTANAKSSGHDINTYGPGYFNALRAVNAPAGDPNRISDPSSLWSRVGDDGDLTTAGVEQLTKLMTSKTTPEGESEAKLQQNAFDVIKSHLSGADLISGQGSGGQKDPKGEEIFAHALPMVYQAIQDGKAKGIPSSQLYDPESKDFVGKSVMGFQRTPAQYVADLVNDNSGKFKDYTTPTKEVISAMTPNQLADAYYGATDPAIKKLYADEGVKRRLGSAAPATPPAPVTIAPPANTGPSVPLP